MQRTVRINLKAASTFVSRTLRYHHHISWIAYSSSMMPSIRCTSFHCHSLCFPRRMEAYLPTLSKMPHHEIIMMLRTAWSGCKCNWNFSKLQKLRNSLEVTIKMLTIETFSSITFFLISKLPSMNFNVRICEKKRPTIFWISLWLYYRSVASVIDSIVVDCYFLCWQIRTTWRRQYSVLSSFISIPFIVTLLKFSNDVKLFSTIFLSHTLPHSLFLALLLSLSFHLSNHLLQPKYSPLTMWKKRK